MKTLDGGTKLALYKDVLSLPALAKTVSQQAIDALEARRVQRLRELGDWRPTNGWQVEPLTMSRA